MLSRRNWRRSVRFKQNEPRDGHQNMSQEERHAYLACSYYPWRRMIIHEGATHDLELQLRTSSATFSLSSRPHHSDWYSYLDQATFMNSSTSEKSSFGLSMAAKCPPVSCLL